MKGTHQHQTRSTLAPVTPDRSPIVGSGLYTLAACLVLSVGLAGCLASSDDDGTDTDEPDGGEEPGEGADELPTIDGLSSDAGDDGLLFFAATSETHRGLHMVRPEVGAPSERVDDEIPDSFLLGTDIEFLFRPVHDADWNLEDDTFEDLRVEHVVYGYESEDVENVLYAFRRVATDADQTTVEPTQVSSGTMYQPAQLATQSDTNDPLGTWFGFPDGDGAWNHIRAGMDADDDPLSFDERYQDFSPFGDRDTGEPVGWLAVDGQEDELRVFDMDGNNLGTPDIGTGSIEDRVKVLRFTASVLNDSSIFLGIALQDDDDEYRQEFWRYQPDPDGVGELHQLSEESGEPFELNAGLAGVTPSLPDDNARATDGEEFVFAYDRGGIIESDAALYRVEGNTVEVLAEAESDTGELNDLFILDGDHVIWSWDERIERVSIADGSTTVLENNSSTDAIATPVNSRSGDWIFYNRESSTIGSQSEHAVARNVADGTLIELEDAEWAGGSTSGAGVAGGDFATDVDISEIFLVTANNELAAVTAEDPEAGMVVLGNLPGSADSARIYGPGPGPHRLIQVYEGETEDNFEVVLVDTREADSLEVVSPEPDQHFQQRPVSNF